MKKKQSIFKVVGLILVTIILLGLIVIVNNLLQEKPGKAVTTIKKTKAASKTYSRLLALNNPPPLPTTTIIPTIVISPTEILLANNNLTPTDSQNQINQLTPTIPSYMDITNMQSTPTIDPTAALLALNGTHITVTISDAISPTSSIIPTNIKLLPETGWIQYSLILFAVAATMFFLAFIF